jgi:hypothetical protein
MAHYVDAGWEDWRAAADLGRELAGKGHKLPVTDLVVAAVAQRCAAWVYSTDPHFDVIPNLKRLDSRGLCLSRSKVERLKPSINKPRKQTVSFFR